MNWKRIIKTSGGWLTENKFREDSIVLQGSKKSKWWEEPELSVEKKYEKLRKLPLWGNWSCTEGLPQEVALYGLK